MGIKSWTDYFLDLAKTCSSRSNCLRAQVGAVIVGVDKKIKATGYNGTPSGVESCYERGECYRIKNNIPSGTCYETCRSIHAEQNAIIQAGQDRCMGASMYIYGQIDIMPQEDAKKAYVTQVGTSQMGDLICERI